jgi:hypothetical protein
MNWHNPYLWSGILQQAIWIGFVLYIWKGRK